jgi:hypothetical protein
MATETAVIFLYEGNIFIWAIPDQLSQPLDFTDHHPPYVPTTFTIPFRVPGDIDLHPIGWKTMSSWYFSSSNPIYFDMICEEYTLHRFQITLQPDLSSASLLFVKTSKLSENDFEYVITAQDCRICEDSLFSCWFYDTHDTPFSPWFLDSDGFDEKAVQYQIEFGLYTGLKFNHFPISYSGPLILPDFGGRFTLLWCPTSGRFVVVLLDQSNSLVIFDFLTHM